MEGFSTKQIVRNFAKTRLPNEIINRPKQGFPVPAYKWLAEGKINELLENSLEILVQKEEMNEKVLSKLFKELPFAKIEDQHKIWNLIIYANWLKKWIN